MKCSISLRLRVTLICGLLLTICCVLLTLGHRYYAYEMADAIEAIPLFPAQTVNTSQTAFPSIPASLPARQVFRTQSLIAMYVIVIAGCFMVYWLTGKALSPLHRLDEQIRNRTASDLDKLLPVPSSADEVAGLTISFNQMSQNLSAAFAQQKRFSQCAAHELRTPLTILKTRMALFRKKGLCNTPETAALLDVLEDQTNRLSHLVNDLLALTNMDHVDCNQTILLSDLLFRVTHNLNELAQTRQITIQLQPDCVTVLGNSILLERAFFNLIENAINYNRPYGTVFVSISHDAYVIKVSVIDEGSGIPPQLHEQIFEPFFRVDQSRSRKLGGVGLGLSLTRSIIELHHGKIEVQSNLQSGSQFIVTLPTHKLSTSSYES